MHTRSYRSADVFGQKRRAGKVFRFVALRVTVSSHVMTRIHTEGAVAAQGVTLARTRPQRINVDVDTEVFAWLSEIRKEDRIATTVRIRALLELAREDPQLRERVIKKARELDEEDEARRRRD